MEDVAWGIDGLLRVNPSAVEPNVVLVHPPGPIRISDDSRCSRRLANRSSRSTQRSNRRMINGEASLGHHHCKIPGSLVGSSRPDGRRE
jgi:hypothetical protein